MSLTSGILIDTLFGPKPVEALRPGDPVLTFEDGVQVLEAVAQATLAPASLAKTVHKPVLIRRNAFGRGTPSRDMLVSPGPKVTLPGLRPQNAASLIDGRRVIAARPKKAVTFVELSFELACTLTANGAPMLAKAGPAQPKRLARNPHPAMLMPPPAPLSLKGMRSH